MISLLTKPMSSQSQTRKSRSSCLIGKPTFQELTPNSTSSTTGCLIPRCSPLSVKINKDGSFIRCKEFMKYYNICFKKSKIHKKDRDSLDLLKSCSENFTDVIENKKYTGADFILDEHHHVIQLNKLKFKQSNQIKRLVNAVEQHFKGVPQNTTSIKSPSSHESSIISSKFLSDTSISDNRNGQRQSVVTVANGKPHFVKLVNRQLFKKTSVEQFMESTNRTP